MYAYKGITLRQPMAMLIMAGIKDVENRYLKITHRGPLLIHVSKTTTDIEPATWGPHTRAAMKTLGFDAKDADCGPRLRAALTPTLGHVIGVVDLVDIVDDSKSRWASPDSEAHWLIRNPRALEVPFAAPGNTSMVNFTTSAPIKLVDGTVLPPHDPGASSTPEPERPAEKTRADTKTPRTASEPRESRAPADDVTSIDVDLVMAAFRQAARGQGTMARLDLLRATSRELGYARLGSTIEATLRNHLRAAVRRRIIEAEGDEVRAATSSIDDYEMEELRDALVMGLRRGQRIEREDAIRQTANSLGFRRVTDNVRAAFKSAFNSAIRQGLLESEGADVVIRR